MKNIIDTKKYVNDKDTLFARHEHSEEGQLKPWKYTDRDAIIMGEDTCRFPFTIKSPVAMSGMSYGALGDHAITALSYGLKDAGYLYEYRRRRGVTSSFKRWSRHCCANWSC